MYPYEVYTVSTYFTVVRNPAQLSYTRSSTHCITVLLIIARSNIPKPPKKSIKVFSFPQNHSRFVVGGFASNKRKVRGPEGLFLFHFYCNL